MDKRTQEMSAKMETCPVDPETLPDEIIKFLDEQGTYMDFKIAYKAVVIPLMKRKNNPARGTTAFQHDDLKIRLDEVLAKVDFYDSVRRPELEEKAIVSHNKSVSALPDTVRSLTEEAAHLAREMLELTTELVKEQDKVIQSGRLVEGFGARGYSVQPQAYKDIRTSWGQALESQVNVPEGGRAIARAILARAGLFQGDIDRIMFAPPEARQIVQE